MGFMQNCKASVRGGLERLENTCAVGTLTLPDFLLALFLDTYVLTRIIPMPSMIANMLAAAAGLLCFAYVILSGVKVPLGRAAAFGIIMCAALFAGLQYNGNGSILYVLWIWSFLGVALLLYGCRFNPKFILAHFYGFCLVLTVYILLGGNKKHFLAVGSENNISVYMLLYYIIYLITRRDHKAPLPYVPLLIAFWIIAWTASRAGLVTMIALFGMTFLYNYFFHEEKQKLRAIWELVKKKPILLVLAALVLASAVLVLLKSSLFASLMKKLRVYGGVSSRTQIWTEYFLEMSKSFTDVLLGPVLAATTYPKLLEYNTNMHNAFVTLHSYFGLLGFTVIAVCLVGTILLSCKKKQHILAVALLTAFVRSFFDWTAFPGPYDVIFDFAVLYLLAGGRSWIPAGKPLSDPNIYWADVKTLGKRILKR